jgi:hypothetical protein
VVASKLDFWDCGDTKGMLLIDKLGEALVWVLVFRDVVFVRLCLPYAGA